MTFICLLIVAGSFARAIAKQHPITDDIPIGENGTLKVNIGFYIESLGNLEATEMTYDMDIFFLASWIDPNWAHEEDIKVYNHKAALNKIWRPDLYFSNSRKGEFQHATVPNFVIYVYQNGTISMSIRVTLKVACNLQLANYPLDTQTCALKIMSYAHTEDRMSVTWFSRKPIGHNRNINMPQFEITKIVAEKCDGNHKFAMTEIGHRRADFSCLLAVIHLHRAIGHHIVQTFIPTTLIVCISWVSFWIDRSAIAARVSLSFSALLTLSTMVAGISHELPPVSYVKAIDIWLGTCVLFVFTALVEFAIVNSLMRTSQRYHEIASSTSRRRRKSLAKHLNDSVHSDRTNGCVGPQTNNIFLLLSDRYSQYALRVDVTSRVLFPVVYAIFAATYWIVYSKN